MGNTTSTCIGRRQFDLKICRPLPTELLCEIAKFIPLKVERKNNKKNWEEEEGMGKVRNFIKKSLNRLPIRRKIVKGNVQPVNADLLVVNSRLTAFLRPRCRALQQMILKLRTDFIIERRNYFFNILIKKKKTNEDGKIINSPISMLEMLRHICYGELYVEYYEIFEFDDNYGTMPLDFEVNQFLECFIRFTLTVPNPDAVPTFQIRLNLEQGQSINEAFQRHALASKPFNMSSHRADCSFFNLLQWCTRILRLYDKVYSNLNVPFQQQCHNFCMDILKNVERNEAYFILRCSHHQLFID